MTVASTSDGSARRPSVLSTCSFEIGARVASWSSDPGTRMAPSHGARRSAVNVLAMFPESVHVVLALSVAAASSAFRARELSATVACHHVADQDATSPRTASQEVDRAPSASGTPSGGRAVGDPALRLVVRRSRPGGGAGHRDRYPGGLVAGVRPGAVGVEPFGDGLPLLPEPQPAARSAVARARADARRLHDEEPVRVLAALQVVPHRRHPRGEDPGDPALPGK